MKMSHILNFVVIIIFFSTGIAFSGDWEDESGKKGRDKQQYNQGRKGGQGPSDHRMSTGDEKGYDDRGQKGNGKSHKGSQKGNVTKQQNASKKGDQKKDNDYNKYKGYRKHPYQKNRQYGYHDHRGHRYEYQGHWRSWEQWERYKKTHPDIHEHGSYYRENTHLMFRFRDPVTGSYFFFSIGQQYGTKGSRKTMGTASRFCMRP